MFDWQDCAKFKKKCEPAVRRFHSRNHAEVGTGINCDVPGEAKVRYKRDEHNIRRDVHTCDVPGEAKEHRRRKRATRIQHRSRANTGQVLQLSAFDLPD